MVGFSFLPIQSLPCHWKSYPLNSLAVIIRYHFEILESITTKRVTARPILHGPSPGLGWRVPDLWTLPHPLKPRLSLSIPGDAQITLSIWGADHPLHLTFISPNPSHAHVSPAIPALDHHLPSITITLSIAPLPARCNISPSQPPSSINHPSPPIILRGTPSQIIIFRSISSHRPPPRLSRTELLPAAHLTALTPRSQTHEAAELLLPLHVFFSIPISHLTYPKTHRPPSSSSQTQISTIYHLHPITLSISRSSPSSPSGTHLT